MDEKSRLRKQLLIHRRSLSNVEIISRSEKIHHQLLSIQEMREAKSIMVYVSYAGEVDTLELISSFFASGIKVLVPVVNREEKKMFVSQINNLSELSPGEYGILEPRKHCMVLSDIDEIDVVLVPGVGFDKMGNRLGQGGGYYDGFLGSVECISIGLAYDFQIQDVLPLENHDMPVDIVVSESEVFRCIEKK